MPMCLHLDQSRGLLVAQASGELTVREVIDAVDTIVEETRGAAVFKPVLILFDERTSLHNLSFEGLNHIEDVIEGWVRVYPGRKIRTAFVACQSMHIAFAKLWQAITVANPAMGATVELFPSEEAALAWLRS